MTPGSVPSGRTRPFDRRLARHARSTRPFLAAATALGAVQTACIVAQAALIARGVTGVFLEGTGAREVGPLAATLVAVAAARGLAAWGSEVAAHRAAATVKSELRQAVLERLVAHGPAAAGRRASGEVAALVTRGVDALDAYFSRYLPQLLLAALLPAGVLAWVLPRDGLSALIMAATLPLVPVFGVLTGLLGQRQVERRWDALARLSGRFLDLLRGLPTLKALGRAREQRVVIRRASEEMRRTTMATLRVAFLSAFVLELVAASATALVAATIGLRVVSGSMTFEPALAILILTPEVYAPLRAAAAQFHASTEGLGAAARMFEILDAPAPRVSGGAPAPGSMVTIRFEEVRFSHPGRDPVLEGATFEIRPGERVALVGPSGAGKSTVLSLLLRFAEAAGGRILAGDRDLAGIDPDAWRRHIAWVPQHPHVFAGTIADNIRLGDPGAGPDAVRTAASMAGALGFVEGLPEGFETRVGEGGRGLSAGERQRLALARAFLRGSPLLLLDEPTAHLDSESAVEVAAAIGRLGACRTVLLVAHHPRLAAGADRVLVLDDGRVREAGRSLAAMAGAR